MLDHCAAIHLAPHRDWSTRCGEIVRGTGMGESCLFLGVDDIARRVRKTPVQFLIISYKTDAADIEQAIAEVRHHRETGVRFMPIIVFSRDSSAATAVHFLKMGCDDIITFPCTLDYLAERLSNQLGRRIDYVHAGDYFGLDRPNLREGDEEDIVERFTVQRDPVHGIKILSQSKKPTRHAG
ncbi:hypothetical protein [Pelagibacterium limicola]|uniref:hypothetical protein n=1 Tax=Pelagibacterium limicola TaxID=2791022 RepID=UPI0018AF8EB1|nr:hypothetical protein [Pelagibacterium limicola]